MLTVKYFGMFYRCKSSISKYPIGYKTTVAAHVAFTCQPLIVDDLIMDERFPKGIATNTSST